MISNCGPPTFNCSYFSLSSSLSSFIFITIFINLHHLPKKYPENKKSIPKVFIYETILIKSNLKKKYWDFYEENLWVSSRGVRGSILNIKVILTSK
jgi:hypothetical protein